MQLDELTKDAQFLLSTMYKNYLDSRQAGKSKIDSMAFGSEFEIHDQLMSQWQQADVRETINELSRQHLLNVMFGSNTAMRVSLSTDAVVLMENKFKNKVNSVIDFVAKVKSTIPFI